jgi:hypothetical protein
MPSNAIEVTILEPDLWGHKESGHVRQGVRYLESILVNAFPESKGRILINQASSFRSPINRYTLEEISPQEILHGKNFTSQIRMVAIRILGVFSRHPRPISLSRLSAARRLWAKVEINQHHSRRKRRVYVVQNIEHIFVPSFSFDKNVFIALRFICKPSDDNSIDFLNAMGDLAKKNPGRIQIAFENYKCKVWFDENMSNLKSFHVPWFGITNKFEQHPNEIRQKSKIVFPGAQRKEKGITVIPEILNNLRAQGNCDLQVSIQFSSDFMEVYDKLSKDENIVILPETLSHEIYLMELRSAFIAILPYSETNYLWTGSGIMADCIAAGTYLIAPRNTAIGAEIDRFNLGRTYTGTSQIPQLITEIYKDTTLSLSLDRYRQLAAEGIDNWLDFQLD